MLNRSQQKQIFIRLIFIISIICLLMTMFFLYNSCDKILQPFCFSEIKISTTILYEYHIHKMNCSKCNTTINTNKCVNITYECNKYYMNGYVPKLDKYCKLYYNNNTDYYQLNRTYELYVNTETQECKDNNNEHILFSVFAIFFASLFICLFSGSLYSFLLHRYKMQENIRIIPITV